jgi:hypothetical protein
MPNQEESGPIDPQSDRQRAEAISRDLQRDGHERRRAGAGRRQRSGALCSEQSNDVTKLPVQRIEEVLQPSGPQRDAFEALKQVATR